MKMFDADKTRMIGLPYGEKKYDDMLNRFHLIPERHGQTNGQTDRIAISTSRVIVTRDKNHDFQPISRRISETIQHITIVNSHQPASSIRALRLIDCSTHQNKLRVDRSFAVQGPRVWNSLPLNCVHQTSRWRRSETDLRHSCSIRYLPSAFTAFSRSCSI